MAEQNPAPGVPIKDDDVACFDCDRFFKGPHTGWNPHARLPGASTGRCPECEKAFQARARDVGMKQAQAESAAGTSAHAREARQENKDLFSAEATARRAKERAERETREMGKPPPPSYPQVPRYEHKAGQSQERYQQMHAERARQSKEGYRRDQKGVRRGRQ